MAVSFAEARSLLTPLAPTPVCYDLDAVETRFDVKYTPEQRDALKDIPFAEDVLRACAGTHMLFPGFPLSLLDVNAKHAAHFYAKTGGWYTEEKQVFSRALVPVCWHLIRTTLVPASLNKTWNEQCLLLVPDEEVPPTAVIAFATMLHFGATGERLFQGCYVRTSDVDSDGYRVRVGFFYADGFHVYDYGDDSRYASFGLSSSRKF